MLQATGTRTERRAGTGSRSGKEEKIRIFSHKMTEKVAYAGAYVIF